MSGRMAVVDAISELWCNEILSEVPLTQMDVESRILGVESADFNSVQKKRKGLCGGAAKGSVSPQQHPKSHVLVSMNTGYRPSVLATWRWLWKNDNTAEIAILSWWVWKLVSNCFVGVSRYSKCWKCIFDHFLTFWLTFWPWNFKVIAMCQGSTLDLFKIVSLKYL